MYMPYSGWPSFRAFTVLVLIFTTVPVSLVQVRRPSSTSLFCLGAMPLCIVSAHPAKSEESGQFAAAVGAQKMLYELLLRRKMDHEAAKASRPGWGYRHGNTKF